MRSWQTACFVFHNKLMGRNITYKCIWITVWLRLNVTFDNNHRINSCTLITAIFNFHKFLFRCTFALSFFSPIILTLNSTTLLFASIYWHRLMLLKWFSCSIFWSSLTVIGYFSTRFVSNWIFLCEIAMEWNNAVKMSDKQSCNLLEFLSVQR